MIAGDKKYQDWGHTSKHVNISERKVHTLRENLRGGPVQFLRCSASRPSLVIINRQKIISRGVDKLVVFSFVCHVFQELRPGAYQTLFCFFTTEVFSGLDFPSGTSVVKFSLASDHREGISRGLQIKHRRSVCRDEARQMILQRNDKVLLKIVPLFGV